MKINLWQNKFNVLCQTKHSRMRVSFADNSLRNQPMKIKMYLKSQSAIEFISLASFMLIVILGFFAITSSKTLEAKEEANKKTAEDIANFAYREIEIAKIVNDGYARTFVMPQTVNGINYSISIVDNRELTVNYLGYEYIKFLPANVTGNVTKGLILITKQSGVVFINSSRVQLPPSFLLLLMKNNVFNTISFESNGNVVLKGTLQQNTNPVQTADDEFVVRDRNGVNIAVIDLVSGNMFIKGSLQQNKATLTPSPSSNDFIVKDSSGNIISYIDESGNFLLKGSLTQNGNP